MAKLNIDATTDIEVDRPRNAIVAGFADIAVGAQRSIGRYFSIVSSIPSVLLVAFAVLLVQTGAWSGSPQWGQAVSEFAKLSVGDMLLLLALSLAVSLALHPLQFALVQFFEGYWGISEPAQQLRSARIRHYRRRAARLRRLDGSLSVELVPARKAGKLGLEFYVDKISMRDEARRLRQNFPADMADVAPTRLGNVLRRYERIAGSSYNLDAVIVFPRLMLTADANHVQHVHDQRIQVDLAVRMCMISLIACLLSCLFLWDNKWWLLIALIPYGLSYLFYRGAVVVAHEFGIAFATLIELNRFALYEKLRTVLPDDLNEEREKNIELMALLQNSLPKKKWVYDHPDVQARRVGLYWWRGKRRED